MLVAATPAHRTRPPHPAPTWSAEALVSASVPSTESKVCSKVRVPRDSVTSCSAAGGGPADTHAGGGQGAAAAAHEVLSSATAAPQAPTSHAVWLLAWKPPSRPPRPSTVSPSAASSAASSCSRLSVPGRAPSAQQARGAGMISAAGRGAQADAAAATVAGSTAQPPRTCEQAQLGAGGAGVQLVVQRAGRDVHHAHHRAKHHQRQQRRLGVAAAVPAAAAGHVQARHCAAVCAARHPPPPPLPPVAGPYSPAAALATGRSPGPSGVASGAAGVARGRGRVGWCAQARLLLQRSRGSLPCPITSAGCRWARAEARPAFNSGEGRAQGLGACAVMCGPAGERNAAQQHTGEQGRERWRHPAHLARPLGCMRARLQLASHLSVAWYCISALAEPRRPSPGCAPRWHRR